ncbi:hypothetical protein HYH02_007518 [Chlamydomonas schloesseri]|uniref:GPI mannosyltransferase 1 n=1 Tax=Chlamydomonas schloesseri TaxID=2026947 RepID=A0A835WHL0_9CHLO|nr:hypothetical protein HYH02_007518 [Chlamydomonas schloesseri]|eukprot:KAG2447595.1 hypothetical protein HYH02_007518 [Chlamydomonas schloesseri]
MAVKYTDIDYVVFTDAARFVANGGSPYQRATYRYSPLLAYLVLPNIWLHPAFGKVLFSAADLLVAGLLSHLLRAAGASPRLRAVATAAWLFNPYTATISTRGSCDVLSVLLLLGLLVMLLHGADVAAGALYGLAVHFRIYPVIYGPATVLFLLRRAAVRQGLFGLHSGGSSSSSSSGRGSSTSTSTRDGSGSGSGSSKGLQRWAQAVRPAAAFCLAAAATFAALGAAFYFLYGHAFLNEAFLHHLGRKDPRHNFSPYYYPIYLQGYAAGGGSSSGSSSTIGAGGASWMPPPPRPGHEGAAVGAATAATAGLGPAAAAARMLLQPLWGAAVRLLPLQAPWRLAAAPQAAALMALSAAFHADLPAAWLLQTWAFVTLNKVVTAQYFVWYLCLLPLALPALAAQTAVPPAALAAGGGLWVAAQLHWLGWAYQLEMKGRSVHVGVWAAGLVFQLANTWLIVLLARALKAGASGAKAAAPPKAGRGDAVTGDGEEKQGKLVDGAEEVEEGEWGDAGRVLPFLEASLRVQGVLPPPSPRPVRVPLQAQAQAQAQPPLQPPFPGFVPLERKQQ